MLADDYNYSFNWANNKLVKNAGDIIDSQIYHYQHWAGRIIGITLTQTMLYIGKDVFNVLNALVFILVVVLIYWHAHGKCTLKFEPGPLILISGLIWLGTAAFGEVVLWLCGSCVYLWTMALILLFLLPYRLTIVSADSGDASIFANIGMGILGLAAGCTNENTALAMLAAAACAVYYCYRQKRLKAWMVYGLAGAVIGYFVLIAAPGNYQRIGVEKPDITLFAQVVNSLSAMLRVMLSQWPIWLTLFFIYRMLAGSIATNFENMAAPERREARLGLFFIALSLFNNLVMVASPEFPPRAGFGSTVYLLIGAMILVKLPQVADRILAEKSRRRIAGVICLIIVATAYLTLKEYRGLHHEFLERRQYILQQKAAENYEIIVPPFSVKNHGILGHVFCSDIERTVSNWKNLSFAQYFGLKSIKAADK
jgi:hypothetical protein